MEDICLSAPKTVIDCYKLFSEVCIESIHNYYGSYGLSEIIMNRGCLLNIFYHEPFYIELDYRKHEEGHQWCATVYKYLDL